MTTNASVNLARDVEASVIPVGTKVTLLKGEEAYITQSLGGSYTIIVRGNMFRLDGKDADALGLEVAATPVSGSGGFGQFATPQQVGKENWQAMRTCYEPENSVNGGGFGLNYDFKV